MNKMDKVTGEKAGKAARAKFKGYSQTGADPKDIMGSMRKVADELAAEEDEDENMEVSPPDIFKPAKSKRKKK